MKRNAQLREISRFFICYRLVTNIIPAISSMGISEPQKLSHQTGTADGDRRIKRDHYASQQLRQNKRKYLFPPKKHYVRFPPEEEHSIRRMWTFKLFNSLENHEYARIHSLQLWSWFLKICITIDEIPTQIFRILLQTLLWEWIELELHSRFKLAKILLWMKMMELSNSTWVESIEYKNSYEREYVP